MWFTLYRDFKAAFSCMVTISAGAFRQEAKENKYKTLRKIVGFSPEFKPGYSASYSSVLTTRLPVVRQFQRTNCG